MRPGLYLHLLLPLLPPAMATTTTVQVTLGGHKQRANIITPICRVGELAVGPARQHSHGVERHAIHGLDENLSAYILDKGRRNATALLYRVRQALSSPCRNEILSGPEHADRVAPLDVLYVDHAWRLLNA